MSLLRWHTPTSQPVVAAKQQPSPLVSSDHLTSLMKQTHYQDSNLTDLVELDILVEYQNTFPARWTDDMRRQPKRYVYQMMAELEVENNPVGATQLAQELLQQLLERTPMQREPPIDHPHGAESVRDHLGADNIIRHMHRTPSAYNRGPPVGKDPYLGTGLNPAHVSGVVSPNDGAVSEMACCGQPFLVERPGGDWVAPPGCWIQLQRGQLYGQPTPYQTWFTQADAAAAAELWQRIALNGALGTLTDATVTGTAFVNENYYRDLDIQIRKLIGELAPAVFQVYQALLNGGFTQPSGFDLLNSKVAQDKLVQLVTLVQLYNAPQMGACHHDRSITGDYLDEHVFFISVGREEFRAGRLNRTVELQGENVPRVSRPTSESFEATLDALQNVSNVESATLGLLGRVVDALRKAEGVLPALQINKEDAEVTFENIDRGFASVNLPNFFKVDINEKKALFDAAEKLAQELANLLKVLPTIVNAWMEAGASGYPENVIPVNNQMQKNIAELEKPIDISKLKKVADLLQVTEDETKKYVIPEEFSSYMNLASVRNYVKANIILDKLRRAKLLDDFDLPPSLFEVAFAAVAAEKARKAAEVAIPRPDLIPQNLSGGRKRVPLISSTKFPVDVKNWTITPGFVYDNESCTYDSLFVFLFWIPNQWLRNQVVTSSSLEIEPQCEPSMAVMIHKTMLQTIEYAERETGAPIQKYDNLCITRTYWETCLPTSGLSGRFSNPIQLLSKLFEFYILDRKQATLFTTPYGKWAPNYENRRTFDLRMFAIVRDEPETRDKEFSMTDPYKIQLTNGEFSMVSCILYTNGHWHACIRNPKNDLWYRMLDTGQPMLLSGTIPREIDRITQTDTARRDEAKYGKGGAKYEPAAWLYYRTEDLRSFYDSLSETNNFPDEPFTDTSGTIVNLFGYTEDDATEEKYYIDELSAFQNVPSTRKYSEMGILTSLLRVATEPSFNLEQINRLIIDPLRYILNSGKYGTRRFPPGVLESFKPQAERVKLLVQGHWAPAWGSGFPAIQPPDDETDKNSTFRSLSSAWCGALFWLLARLRNKQMPPSVNSLFNINVVVNKEWKLVNK